MRVFIHSHLPFFYFYFGKFFNLYKRKKSYKVQENAMKVQFDDIEYLYYIDVNLNCEMSQLFFGRKKRIWHYAKRLSVVRSDVD